MTRSMHTTTTPAVSTTTRGGMRAQNGTRTGFMSSMSVMSFMSRMSGGMTRASA